MPRTPSQRISFCFPLILVLLGIFLLPLSAHASTTIFLTSKTPPPTNQATVRILPSFQEL